MSTSSYAHRFKVRMIDGRLYDPWDPVGDSPAPATVAYALARLCRYGGHVKRFYSVAEHTLWCALNLACDGADNGNFKYAATMLARGDMSFAGVFNRSTEEQARLAILALVHDAPEGCGLVDVPGPILRHEEMAAYKRAHERCMAWLCRGWGLQPPPWPDEIKAVDYAILGAELAIRPDGATEGSAQGESLTGWTNLDLLEDHNLNLRGDSNLVHDAWVEAYRALRERIVP